MMIYVVGYLLLSLSLPQDPVESSSCLDFYQLVLFYATTGDGAGVTVDHGGDTVLVMVIMMVMVSTSTSWFSSTPPQALQSSGWLG